MNNQRIGFFNTNFSVTLNIVIINALIWLACYITKRPDGGSTIMEYLGLHYFQSEGFKIHQLITYMFLHDVHGIEHIFFNMFAVYMFGRTIETIWGGKQYLFFYLITGIGAGLVQEVVWYFTLNPMYYDIALTVGASGAVFGILLAFGMMFPNAPLYIIFFPIPIKAKYMVIGYGLIELFLGVSNRSGDNVAHFAHLGGMLFGIILILYWKKKGKLYGQRYR